MATAREAIGLAIAGLIGLAAYALTAVPSAPSSFEELRGLLVMAGWFVGPLAIASTILAAPAVLIARRQSLLNLWSAVAIFVVCPMAVTAVQFVADGEAFYPAIKETAAELLLFGVVAGVTYWAIVMLPSNSALQRTRQEGRAVERER